MIDLRSMAFIIVTAVITGSCASGGGDGTVRRGHDCFWSHSVNGYKVLDDRTLLVWAPTRRCAYRVELSGFCTDLKFASQIAFHDRDGRICGYGGDAVLVPGSFGGRCPINSVTRLAPGELDSKPVEVTSEDVDKGWPHENTETEPEAVVVDENCKN